ncbi:MAG TPA: RnfABCDGE type electron transport complex subunit B [Gammaproteobacteria bacterium]|nr:RnfABCDGE type electron transport complex subunit B [Gammaproteobacteria bacterium]
MLTAVIREAECIGCSRCIPACPVDAILGTHKFLHTVLTDECIGCKLCIDPCPVDCIDMVPLSSLLPAGTEIDKPARAVKAKSRHKARQLRLQQEAQRTLPLYQDAASKREQIRQEIAESLARMRSKRNEQSHN